MFQYLMVLTMFQLSQLQQIVFFNVAHIRQQANEVGRDTTDIYM